MEFLAVTNSYYSKWLGQDEILNEDFCGIKFIYSEERNVVQYGYGQQFDLYVWCQPHRIIISYGNKVAGKIEIIKDKIQCVKSVDEVKQVLTQIFGISVNHNIKYVYNEKVNNPNLLSRRLEDNDYTYYEDFFKKCNPGCSNITWLREYFDEMLAEHLCNGIFVNDILVSCTDAPGMPYMQSEVQEVGINTLKEYRGNGYAKDVCIKCIDEIIKINKCPMWSTEITNIPSQKLAQAVGFVKLADILSVTL